MLFFFLDSSRTRKLRVYILASENYFIKRLVPFPKGNTKTETGYYRRRTVYLT